MTFKTLLNHTGLYRLLSIKTSRNKCYSLTFFFSILLAQNPVVGEKKENICVYLEHGKLTAQMGVLSSCYFANYFSSYLQNLN